MKIGADDALLGNVLYDNKAGMGPLKANGSPLGRTY